MADKELYEPLRYDRAFGRSRSRSACFVASVATFVAATLAIVLAVVWVEQLPCDSSSSSSKQQTQFSMEWIRFFHISDVHLDPEYDETISAATFCRNSTGSMPADFSAPYGRVGCDSPNKLVKNVFHAMKNASKTDQPDFIVVTGDMSAHHLGSSTGNNVLYAITVATEELQKTFPSTYVFPCLGNNDVPEDYYIPPQPNATEWYEKLLDLWKSTIFCSSCQGRVKHPPVNEREFRQTFLKGGYYKAQISPKMILLVLNTIYYSTKATVRNQVFLETAQGQLDWLKSELQKASVNGHKVIISGHIPPGFDPYSLSTYWYDDYTTFYVKYTSEVYPHVIGGQLYGHLHKDDFRFFNGNSKEPSVQKSSAMLLTASLTPVYRNNPTFRLMYVDDDKGTFTDYKQWYLSLTTADEFMVTNWLYEYTFSEAFPSALGQVINPQRILDIANGIISKTKESTWLQYIWHRQVEYLPDEKTFSRNRLYCCLRCSNDTEFDQCKQSLPFIPG